MHRNALPAIVALSFALTASAAEPKKAHGPVGSLPPIHTPDPKTVILNEGFEVSVPPPGWILQVKHTGDLTWHSDTVNPHAGAADATVLYDPALVPQDEWLLSPVQNLAAGTTTLSLWSMGSVYWCRDTYNNCDLEVWLVVGTVGGGDDILLGTADGAWPSSYTWAQSTFDLSSHVPIAASIGLRYVGTDGAQIGLDDVMLDGTLVPVELQRFTIAERRPADAPRGSRGASR